MPNQIQATQKPVPQFDAPAPVPPSAPVRQEPIPTTPVYREVVPVNHPSASIEGPGAITLK